MGLDDDVSIGRVLLCRNDAVHVVHAVECRDVFRKKVRDVIFILKYTREIHFFQS